MGAEMIRERAEALRAAATRMTATGRYPDEAKLMREAADDLERLAEDILIDPNDSPNNGCPACCGTGVKIVIHGDICPNCKGSPMHLAAEEKAE